MQKKAFIAGGTISNEDPSGQQTINIQNGIYLKIKNIGAATLNISDNSALNFDLPADESIEFYFKGEYYYTGVIQLGFGGATGRILYSYSYAVTEK